MKKFKLPVWAVAPVLAEVLKVKDFLIANNDLGVERLTVKQEQELLSRFQNEFNQPIENLRQIQTLDLDQLVYKLIGKVLAN